MDGPDPTTEQGWAEAERAAAGRMRRALAKIDHERRGSLLQRVIAETSTPAEEAELRAMNAACDAAMAEHDDLMIRYQVWMGRQVSRLLARTMGGAR